MLSNRVFTAIKSTDINCEKFIDGLEEKSLKPELIDKSKTSENGKFSQTNPMSVTDLGKMLLNSCREGDTNKVHELMCRGAPFTTDWLGTSPIHLAAMNNHIETCEVLLRAGMSKDAKTKVDRTPLHFAVFEGHEKMVELLLINKCEVDSKDMLKMTPLHWAIQKKHKRICELLLQHNADPNVVSKFGKTPLIIALETGQDDVVKLIEMAISNRLENPQQTQEATDQLVYEMQQQESNELEEERIPPLTSIKLESGYQTMYNIQSGHTPTETTASTEAEIEEIEESNIIEDSEDGEESTSLSEAITQLQNVDEPKPIDASTLQMLKEHGISMTHSDETDTSLITSVLQSGRKLVLSEAGKLVLNDPKFKKLFMDSPLSSSNPPPLIQQEHINATTAIQKKTNIIPSKNVPIKTNKVIKILSAEQFKQMCGGDLTNAIKLSPQESQNKKSDMRLQQSRVSTILQLNNQKVKRPVMSKNKISYSPAVKNITYKSPTPPSNTIVHQVQSSSQYNINNNEKDFSNIIQSIPPSLSIKREVIPLTRSVPATPNNSNHNNKVVITSIQQPMSVLEMEKQILELKKITEDLRKQFELSQKENEELKLRVDRLEKEREFISHENDDIEILDYSNSLTD